MSKRANSRRTRENVAAKTFLTSVEPAFFREFVDTLAENRRSTRFPVKAIEGFFELQRPEDEFIRWCWGWRLAEGGKITWSWICSIKLTPEDSQGLRGGVLSTPQWKERDGRMSDGGEWFTCKEALFERLRVEDPRFKMIETEGASS